MEVIEGKKTGEGNRFAIVVSRFNEAVSKRLLEGAQKALAEGEVPEDDILVVWVPGAFEIPATAQKIADADACEAVICLGAVIRGQTPHFDYISQECTRGLAEVSRECEIPVLFGVLTCDTLEQAMERSGGNQGNKGYEAAQAAIEMANLFDELESL